MVTELNRKVTNVTKISYIIGSVVAVVGVFIGIAVNSIIIYEIGLFGLIIMFISIVTYYIFGDNTSVEMF